MSKNIELYLSEGKKIVKMGGEKGKVPCTSGWNKDDYISPSLEELSSHNGSLAWALGEKDIVIDVDIKHNGLEGLEKLREDIKKIDPSYDLRPTVVSQSGGYHFYFKVVPGKPLPNIKKEFDKYKGVEFLTKGNCCNIVNEKKDQVGVQSGRYCWHERNEEGVATVFSSDDAVLPQKELPDVLYKIIGDAYEEQDQKKKKVKSVKKITKSFKKVLDRLEVLNPDMSHDKWVKVGMAIHSIDQGELGLSAWDNWSTTGKKYTKDLCAKKWVTFEVGEITAASLDYDPVVKEERADWYKLQYVEEKDNSVGDWVYVCHSDKVYNKKTRLGYKLSVWGTRFFSNHEGRKKLASFLKKGLIECAETITYLPYEKKVLIKNKQDKKYLRFNIYNPSNVMAPSKEYTEKGKNFVDVFVENIKNLCNQHLGEECEKDGEIFLQWIAHQVQNPGKQLRWCPLICSKQGYGKGFIIKAMERMLGYSNVSIVRENLLSSTFNEWAEGTSLVVLDEFLMKGRDRERITSTVKTHITEETIRIHPKGSPSYEVENVANYIAFTNDEECMRIPDGERRFWIIICQINKKEELAAMHGMGYEEFCFFLAKGIENYSDQLKKYFLELEISKEFKNLVCAPPTKYKQDMIEKLKSETEFLDEAEELLMRGGSGFSQLVIRQTHFFEKLEKKYNSSNRLSVVSRKRIMDELGFRKTTRIMHEGTKIRVYIKNTMPKEEVKKYYEQTLKCDEEKCDEEEPTSNENLLTVDSYEDSPF